MSEVVYTIPRPHDMRYPDGFKTVRVSFNPYIVEVDPEEVFVDDHIPLSRLLKPREPFLFELDGEELESRLNQYMEKLNVLRNSNIQLSDMRQEGCKSGSPCN